MHIPGPDLPGGGVIMGRDGVRERPMRRDAEHLPRVHKRILRMWTARKKAIIVTELPLLVGPEKVLEHISEGVKNKKNLTVFPARLI